MRQYAFNEGCFITNQKTRSVGPHKSKLEKTTSKKKSSLKNKKFSSVSTQLSEGSAKSSSGEKNILQQRLLYTNEDMKNYPFINTNASIPILAWKITKNCSHIISNNSFLVVYYIMETIRGSNLILNHQVYQRRI